MNQITSIARRLCLSSLVSIPICRSSSVLGIFSRMIPCTTQGSKITTHEQGVTLGLTPLVRLTAHYPYKAGGAAISAKRSWHSTPFGLSCVTPLVEMVDTAVDFGMASALSTPPAASVHRSFCYSRRQHVSIPSG